MGDKYQSLEDALIRSLGFERSLDSTGQIYPRSIDYDVITTLVLLSAAASNLATSIRLMAGHDLVSEGFKAGQVGSSAMPHKMNTRSCERINGLAAILMPRWLVRFLGFNGMRVMSQIAWFEEWRLLMASML
jgi:adenylosuccinate lyase